MKRFILVILDGFGVGYMDDVTKVRPQDEGANTCRHILDFCPDLKLKNLEKLGLMNVLGSASRRMGMSSDASYGKAGLRHIGADTFYGHQEIMGTKPVEPIFEPFSKYIDKVYNALKNDGHTVEYVGISLKYLLVDGCVTVADNIEADEGQIYNVTAPLDLIKYEDVVRIGRTVRKVVDVPRVIAFGGRDISVQDILNAAEEKRGIYIGINAPKSGVYKNGYRVIHMGCGVDPEVQVPAILGRAGIPVVLLGKAADIIENEYGRSIPCVDTAEVLMLTLKEMQSIDSGLIAVNVQETDLAGHAQDADGYAEKLLIADSYIGRIMNAMDGDDLLLVMADHGNDPTIGHSHHTRENVPLLLYGQNVKNGCIGYRNTLSDAGATILNYFGCRPPQSGESFLNIII